jgi:hypothetical protein
VGLVLSCAPGVPGIPDSARTVTSFAQQPQPLATPNTAVPYTTRLALQYARLDECRQQLNPDYDFTKKGEFGPYLQGTALICELGARRRGQGDNPLGAVSDAEIDRLMSRLVERLAFGVGVEGSWGDRPRCNEELSEGPRACFVNFVIARYAAFFAAYVFATSGDFPWTLATRNSAYQLFKEGNWYPWGYGVGNSTLPLIGMRIFAGQFFHDPVLFTHGRSQLYASRDYAVRHGLGEPMAPHYAGMTLVVLAMMTDTTNLEIKDIASNLTALSLLVPAHLYLPGGGLGAPQEREKTGGGIADPDPMGASHLISAINLLIYDPELNGAGYPAWGLASGYQVPEIIRSIFLDKGRGYGFRYRGASPSEGHKQLGWYPGRRSYRSLGRGIVTRASEVEADPWAAVMLRGGRAQMGLAYGSGSLNANSSGLYVRKPGPLQSGRNSNFSILYQHQPRRPSEQGGGGYEPLQDDPTWHFERKRETRRILHGRTAIALFDVGLNASGGDPAPAAEFPYTMVHLPDFADSRVGDGMKEIPSASLPGHTWFVGQSANAYVAYLPLGVVTKRETVSSEAGDWIYLQLGGPVSGGITELASTDTFPTLQHYADHLATRHVSFKGTSAAEAHAEIAAVSPAGSRIERVRLEFEPERRYIDGVQQADADFLMLRGMIESPFVSWDESSYTLSVERDGFESLSLNFGDPQLPTAPRRASLLFSNGVVLVSWKHGFDDVGIAAYDIYRNDRRVGVVNGAVTKFSDRPPLDGSEGTLFRYTVASRDGDWNVSPTRTPILEVQLAPSP